MRASGAGTKCRKGRTVHLGGDDGAGQNTAANGDQAGEGALLVDVRALNGRLGRAEPQTNVLVPSPVTRVLAGSADLVVQEDMRLSNESSVLSRRESQGLREEVPASGRRAPTGLCGNCQ
jgi:hypothetical protein